MIRVQAAACLRRGEWLEILIRPPTGKKIIVLVVYESKKIIASVGYGKRIHLNWKQLLGLLRRNYKRSYMDSVHYDLSLAKG